MANRQARGAALGGVIVALSVVLLMMASIFPLADLLLPALAGILLVAVVLELDVRWAWCVFAAVCLLGFLLSPDRTSVIYYLFFFGHYPLLKNYIERLHSKILQWVLKLPLFNVCAIAAYLLIIKLFGVSENVGRYGYPVLLALMNAAFILYDIALSRLIVTYFYRIRKMFHH